MAGLIKKIKISRQASEIKETQEDVALEIAKIARGFSRSGNTLMADYWWKQYELAMTNIEDCNELILN